MLKFFVNALKVMHTESQFSCREDGIFAVVKCPTNARVGSAWLSAKDMIEYEVEEEEETAGVDIYRLGDILKSLPSDIDVELIAGSPNPIQLKAEDVKYHIDNIEILSMRGQIPRQEKIELMRTNTTTKLQFKAGDFKKGIGRCMKINENTCELQTNNGKLDILAKGTIDKVASSIDLISFSGENASSQYNTGWINELLKPIPSTSTASMWFATKFHMSVQFEKDNSYVEFGIAYKMEDEEE